MTDFFFLNEQRERLEELLVNLPDGKLLVAPGKSDDSFRYYLRSTPQDKMGVYLHKEDSELKSQLAFKKYATAAVKNISEEIDKLEKVQKLELKDSLIGTYEDLNQGVKQLINPIVVDDETYIKMWKSIPYEGLSFSPDDKTEYYSNLNERMRSKSEVSIANMLLELGIPYKYECPIIRKNGENFYPDFTIHAAIAENKQIKFKYFQWNIKKEQELKHDGKFIEVSPWALTWDGFLHSETG